MVKLLRVSINRFTLKFGQPYNSLVDSVLDSMKKTFSKTDKEALEGLIYPNAICIIQEVSIRHNSKDRIVIKKDFIGLLNKVQRTVISELTLSLKTKKQIMSFKRKELKKNLTKNPRLRYFLIHKDSVKDFESEVVIFICDYLDKHHFKIAHEKTPIFCLDCPKDEFWEIENRLFGRGVITNNGYRGKKFEEAYFLREPIKGKNPQKEYITEFKLRLLHWETQGNVLNKQKCHDLFVIGCGGYEGINDQDIDVVELEVSTLKEVEFLLGVSDVYE